MDSVRWGVLSVSNHYTLRVHHQLIGSEVTKVVGIASRDAERARRAARELGLGRSYGSYEAMLADPEIDAVYIPLPNHLHAQWIKKAADAGKHVLCEKPFAM
ncbi:MAG: Gfo/Idh/MocA family oxidoreductase, partial [Rectinema sp.]